MWTIAAARASANWILGGIVSTPGPGAAVTIVGRVQTSRTVLTLLGLKGSWAGQAPSPFLPHLPGLDADTLAGGDPICDGRPTSLDLSILFYSSSTTSATGGSHLPGVSPPAEHLLHETSATCPYAAGCWGRGWQPSDYILGNFPCGFRTANAH